MELFAQQPFWLMKNGMLTSFGSLDRSIVVDVAVIGAGISGALAAYYLRNSDVSVAVLEQRHAGMGSTAASTSFLQYEIDTPLRFLSEKIGFNNAVQCYRLCRQAIYKVERLCKTLRPEFDFHTRPSLQYCSFKKDVPGLYSEYSLRKEQGFKVSWLERDELAMKFGLDAPAALLSEDGGEVDAYLLTHALLRAVESRGHNVYTNTRVSEVAYGKRSIRLTTDRGYTIRAKKVIIACGYESLRYLPKPIAKVHTTYAIVSEPLTDEALWHRDSLVWETATPYLYFRKVDGDRILVGGKDDPFHRPHLLASAIKKKSEQIEQSFNNRMPHLRIRADYAWGGAFITTSDGLPYIGKVAGRPHALFALGYGGNGITFSVLAAEMLRDEILGKANKNAHLFSFNRT